MLLSWRLCIGIDNCKLILTTTQYSVYKFSNKRHTNAFFVATHTGPLAHNPQLNAYTERQ